MASFPHSVPATPCLPLVFLKRLTDIHLSQVNNWKTCFAEAGGSEGKESACNAEDWGWSLGQEDPLEKGIATLSSILAWRIPRTEEPDRLQSIQSQEVDLTERISLTHSLYPLTVLTHCTILLIILSLKLMTRWIELQGDHFYHLTIWFSISTISLGEIKSNYAKVQPGNTWQLFIRCSPSKDLNLIIILLWWMFIMCIWTSF